MAQPDIEPAVDPILPSEGSPVTMQASSDKEKDADLPTVDARPAFPRMTMLRSCLLVLTVSLSMAINILSTQSALIALPSIGAELNIPDANLQWIISAYSITFGCGLLVFGRLSDLYGHKLVFCLGTAWFAIWSLGCGFAPTEIGLDIMRAMQGFGAAASIPSAMGIIACTFPPGPTKSTAFATFSAGAPFGASIGNVIGGVLTTYASDGWHSIFFTSTGLAALICLGGIVVVPKDGTHVKSGDRSVDWLGAFLVTAGLILLTFALADGETASKKGYGTPYIPTLLVISVILLAVFGWWEYRIENHTNKVPLMRLSLFRKGKGKFTVVQIIAFFGWSCFATHQFLVTLYYQDFLRLTPIETTVRFLPMAIMGLCLNVIVAIVAARAPAQVLIVIGALGTSLAPLLFAVMPTNATYWRYQFPAMLLTVLGADFIFASGIMLCSFWADRTDQAMAAGIFNELTQLGTAFGLAIMTIIKDRVAAKETTKMGGTYDINNSASVPSAALLKGLQAGFYGCFAFGMVACVLAILFLKGSGTPGEKPLEEEVLPPTTISNERTERVIL